MLLLSSLVQLTFTSIMTDQGLTHLLLGDGVGRVVEVDGHRVLVAASPRGEVTIGGQGLVAEGRQSLVKLGDQVWKIECQNSDKIIPPSHWAFRGVVRGAPVDQRMVDALHSNDRKQFEEEQIGEGVQGREWFPSKEKWVLDLQSIDGKKRKSESLLPPPLAKRHVPESIW